MSLKQVALIFVIGIYGINVNAQDSLTFYRPFYKESYITAGYNYSFDGPNKKKFHLLEMGLMKSSHGGYHPTNVNWGFGTEVGVNTDRFLIGPKIGGYAGHGFLILGSEFVYYTDFHESTLRYVPYFGIGNHAVKITFNPHIRLTNKDFKPVNKGQVNLTISILRLKKRQQ